MTAKEKLYSAEDLWRVSHEAGEGRMELVKGQIIEMSPAGALHGGLAHFIGLRIGVYVEVHQLGYVGAAETGFILFTDPEDGDTVRAPDVSYVQATRLPETIPNGYFDLAPDLAVEVVSPNDRADDIDAKIEDYLRAGVRLIWFVYPKSRSVQVYTQTTMERLYGEDVLDGRDVLPGFRLAVSEIFNR